MEIWGDFVQQHKHPNRVTLFCLSKNFGGFVDGCALPFSCHFTYFFLAKYTFPGSTPVCRKEIFSEKASSAPESEIPLSFPGLWHVAQEDSSSCAQEVTVVSTRRHHVLQCRVGTCVERHVQQGDCFSRAWWRRHAKMQI